MNRNGSLLRPGLPALTTVAPGATFSRNWSLVDLSGLEALTTVGENLLVTWNHSLSDVSALDGLQAVGGDLVVVGNPCLDETAVQTVFADVLVGGALAPGWAETGPCAADAEP